uniref:Uncharacterized protein n=1 Tax=viral metagenome TaxID=1070528 RepID=A0A6H1Z956_9ZZZZ
MTDDRDREQAAALAAIRAREGQPCPTLTGPGLARAVLALLAALGELRDDAAAEERTCRGDKAYGKAIEWAATATTLRDVLHFAAEYITGTAYQRIDVASVHRELWALAGPEVGDD